MRRTIRGSCKSGYCCGVSVSRTLPSRRGWPVPSKRLLARRTRIWAWRACTSRTKAALKKPRSSRTNMPWWIEPKRPLARRLPPTAPQRGNGPHNGMGADFDQQHGKQVGERTRCRRRRAALVTETGPVLCRICHSELGSINTHQAQTKRETARGLLLSKGTADPLEELTKDAHAQQATTVAEGSRGRSGVAVVLAAEAPGAQEAITHLPQRTLCHHAPSDQQVDHDQVIELAFTLLLGPILVKQVGNHCVGIGLFKHRKGQQMAKLVSGDDLRYSWQGRELLLTSLLVFFSMSDLELPLPLFKWY